MAKTADRFLSDRTRGKLLLLGFHPLGVLWLLCAIALVTGLVEWLAWDRSPWPGLSAAFGIGGLTEFAARLKGVPAWPWQIEDGTETDDARHSTRDVTPQPPA